jgi:hypothetical protein
MKINVLKNTILFCKAIQKDIELAGKKKYHSDNISKGVANGSFVNCEY